jgi:hypothetical protein
MALNITPKSASTSTTSSAVTPQTPRPQVTLGKQTTTTARAEALKARLTNQTPAPIAPRPAGSTARAEQYSKLQKYTDTQPATQTNTQNFQQPMQDVAPPPAQPQVITEQVPQHITAQLDNNADSPKSPLEDSKVSDNDQFAAFEHRERQILKAQRRLQEERARLKDEQDGFIQKAKQSPLQFLAENGITYDKLVELQLNQANPDPNQEIIDKRLAEIEKKFDERLAKENQDRYQAALKQISSDVNFLVNSDPAFETIKTLGEQSEVVTLIEKVFNQEDAVLSVEEACQLVENKLFERKQREIERLSGVSKFKQRLARPSETRQEETPAKNAQPTPTLTNQGSVARPLTARERAILAVEQANQRARNKV